MILADVPPLATVTPDARRRFGNLVNVAWDCEVRLIVLADGPRPQILDTDLTDHERMSRRLQLLQTA